MIQAEGPVSKGVCRGAIIMEYCQMSLESYVRSQPSKLPPSLIHLWMHQLCKALSTMHAHGYIHRDVKPENCMLSVQAATGTMVLKLADYGSCHLRGGPSADAGLTPGMCKQTFVYGSEVDKWSVGG